MGFYADQVFPHLMDWILRGPRFQQQRKDALRSLHGDVLEIGFGTGLNLPHYPAAVASLVALDPATLIPKRVARRVTAATVPVMIVAGEAERLPFAGRRFDGVVSIWTLCTITEVSAALREVGRVLKPGGRYVFLEHGRSDSPRIAAWQDRLNPLQRRLACGCNLNRPIDRLIANAGLRLTHLDRFRMPGVPRIGGEMYRGVAVPPPG